MLQSLLCRMLDPGVHIICWALLLLSGQIQPPHQHVVHQNIFLRVKIERAANDCDTGLTQALDTVAMLARVA